MATLRFLSNAVWNDYFRKFLEDFCKKYPELKYCDQSLLQVLKRCKLISDAQVPYSDLEKQKALLATARANAIANGSTVGNSSVLIGLPGLLGDSKEKEKLEKEKKIEEYKNLELVLVSKLFLDSFRPYAHLLKTRNIELLKKRDCMFIKYLELNKVWTTKMTEEDHNDIWSILNGAYLILELIVCTPPAIMERLEMMISNLFTQVVVEKQDFVKEEFTANANIILRDLDQASITKMTDYFWEFITSKNTPIFAIVEDKRYHKIIDPIIKAIQSDAGRKIIAGHMAPLVDDIKNRVGDTIIKYDEKGNSLGFDDEAAITGVETTEIKEMRNKEKERILSCVIDALAEIISKNKTMLRDMLDHPAKGMEKLLSGIVPIIGEMMVGMNSGGSGGGGISSLLSGITGSSSSSSSSSVEKARAQHIKGGPVVRRIEPVALSSSSSTPSSMPRPAAATLPTPTPTPTPLSMPPPTSSAYDSKRQAPTSRY